METKVRAGFQPVGVLGGPRVESSVGVPPRIQVKDFRPVIQAGPVQTIPSPIQLVPVQSIQPVSGGLSSVPVDREIKLVAALSQKCLSYSWLFLGI